MIKKLRENIQNTLGNEVLAVVDEPKKSKFPKMSDIQETESAKSKKIEGLEDTLVDLENTSSTMEEVPTKESIEEVFEIKPQEDIKKKFSLSMPSFGKSKEKKPTEQSKKETEKPKLSLADKFATDKKFTQNTKSKHNGLENSSVLNFLGIDFEIKLDDLMSEKDIDEVEFSLSAPTGLDPKEVERFLDRVRDAILKYKSVIHKRENDFKKLLAEFNELENKYTATKHENEFAIFEQMMNE